MLKFHYINGKNISIFFLLFGWQFFSKWLQFFCVEYYFRLLILYSFWLYTIITYLSTVAREMGLPEENTAGFDAVWDYIPQFSWKQFILTAMTGKVITLYLSHHLINWKVATALWQTSKNCESFGLLVPGLHNSEFISNYSES